jgi:hypothetical protein
LVAAIPVTGPYFFLRFLLAVLFLRSTDIVTFFDTALTIATNVTRVPLGFDRCSFPG